MAITLRCSNEKCGKLLQVPDHAAEKKVRCPLCGQVQSASEPAILLAEEEAAPAASDEEAIAPVPFSIPTRRRQQAMAEPELELEETSPSDRYRDERILDCPECEAEVWSGEERCPACAHDLTAEALEDELDALKRQRTLFQVLSLVFGITGLGLAGICWTMDEEWLFLLCLGLGILLFWIGLGFAVAYQRDNPVWIVLGLLGIFGLIGLVCLPDEKQRRLRRIQQLLAEARRRRRQRDPDEEPLERIRNKRVVKAAPSRRSQRVLAAVGVIVLMAAVLTGTLYAAASYRFKSPEPARPSLAVQGNGFPAQPVLPLLPEKHKPGVPISSRPTGKRSSCRKDTAASISPDPRRARPFLE